MNPTIVSAFIALAGVVIGFLGRDIGMQLILARQKRKQEIDDRNESRARANQELVRAYANPLLESTRSLRFRLDEIVTTGRADYLLAVTPKTPFNEYKRVSTVYRLAVLLGWIRAFRKERSYLNPSDVARETLESPIVHIERALADGHHVEQQRLDELLRVWRVPREASPEGAVRVRVAAILDAKLQEFLGAKGNLVDSKTQLAHECAALIARELKVDIPTELVQACVAETSATLGIKEAYIYRDWQAALGDLMLVEASGGPRRFDILGFGEFEARYLAAQRLADETERRWFDRLGALFHDLDMSKTGVFDARRQQVHNLREACIALETYLSENRVL